jgi:hypothetical protein
VISINFDVGIDRADHSVAAAIQVIHFRISVLKWHLICSKLNRKVSGFGMRSRRMLGFSAIVRIDVQ